MQYDIGDPLESQPAAKGHLQDLDMANSVYFSLTNVTPIVTPYIIAEMS
jgi:hypothetical protein